jgi:MoaA/NifB/PqqE/SkfB family radical SAM enzyme
MFKPEEIIFAPTAECNLVCSHCRVTRIPDRLEAAAAVAFLKSCRPHGVERVGFSGGEPFLRPDFLCDVVRAAVGLDMVFGRLMTNGVWAESPQDLERTLSALHEAGFDGTFGVSVDSYHAQVTEELTRFFQTVFSVWGRRDRCEIISVMTSDGETPKGRFESLAEKLGGRLLLEDGEPFSIVNEAFLDRTEAADGESTAMMINIIRVPYSPAAEENAWDSTVWFEDDYCRGPGNVFYVHPDGRVAVCCGFANENPGLIIGRIPNDGYRELMRRAGASPVVKACYETGLAAVRERLEANEVKFPGKTNDPCFFCDYCAKKNLPIPRPAR